MRVINDQYTDEAARLPELADRERVARALFIRRGYKVESWDGRWDTSLGLRRDCRYLAEAAIGAINEH